LTTVVSALPSSSTRSSTASAGRKTPRKSNATHARSHTVAVRRYRGPHATPPAAAARRLARPVADALLILVPLVHEFAEVEVRRLERVRVETGRQLWHPTRHRRAGAAHARPAAAGRLALALVLRRLRRLAATGQAHHAAHLLHHLLRVLEAVEQLV